MPFPASYSGTESLASLWKQRPSMHVCMLEQSVLCWWYWVQRLRAMGGKPFSGFTDRGLITVLGLHQHSPVFQTCHILGSGDTAAWVLGQGDKGICNMKNIQHISSIFWQCQTLMEANHTLCRHERVTELGCIVLQAVQQSHDGKDNHTCVHCSEVGFIVPPSCLHRDTATTAGLLLSSWSAFVMNRCKFASAVVAWSFFT